MRISAEQIYAWIAADASTGGALYRLLRRQHKRRGRRTPRASHRARREPRLDISQRPEIVDQRARFSDWEGHTVLGFARAAIATHVERRSGYVVAFKRPNRESIPLAKATVTAFQALPTELRRTMIYDNGSEFRAFERIEQQTGFQSGVLRPTACPVVATRMRMDFCGSSFRKANRLTAFLKPNST